MNIPDDLLTAYVDGELEGAERARIEQAILHDARLAQRVARHRALRARLRRAFDSALHEPIPQRLLQAAKFAAPTSSAQIIDLARVRGQRKRHSERHRALRSRRIAIAASLIAGLLIGLLAERLTTGGALTEYRNGALLARGGLAAALDSQLASSPTPGGQVRIGISFRAKSGNYCRTFSLNDDQSLAGLACHAKGQWQLLTLVGTPNGAGNARQGMRMAGSAMPPVLLQAVHEQISGEPLDAQAEAKARSDDWR